MRHYPSDSVDLRSDTVTQPTPGMRDAMSVASVGDDVLGDDQTVIELQEGGTDVWQEEALFVPSGTMSNAIAIRAQTEPGDEVITQRHSHIYVYEEEAMRTFRLFHSSGSWGRWHHVPKGCRICN